jgi:glycosyltransferase involved in cell wall biosynthesis
VILGVDASNIRAGGGLTHLVEMLKAAEPAVHGFSRVIVWGGNSTLKKLGERDWLVKSHLPCLDRSLPIRACWQRLGLSALARASHCDLLFVPGGTYVGDFHPIVTMSRNLLPFEWRELKRFGWSLQTLKLLALRASQARTFRRADGLIFLTLYAGKVVMRAVKVTGARTTIIPHGIDASFLHTPREQWPRTWYSSQRPIRILYASIVDLHKHQWHVAEAVSQLRRSGMPVVLDFLGPAYPPALKRLRAALHRLDPAGEFIRYAGPQSHASLPAWYAQGDVCLFASSCENMPNILLEGMASGLPIACSALGPMPEVLGPCGIYFDPENAADIARALRELIDSPALRIRLAHASFERVQSYSWRRCAADTFGFLAAVAARGRE